MFHSHNLTIETLPDKYLGMIIWFSLNTSQTTEEGKKYETNVHKNINLKENIVI